MSTISIREYEHLSAPAGGTIPVGEEPALASQVFTITGGSQQSNAFHIRTKFVRINVDVATSVNFGLAPVASNGTGNMPAGQTEYFGVAEAVRGSLKVAFIAL